MLSGELSVLFNLSCKQQTYLVLLKEWYKVAGHDFKTREQSPTQQSVTAGVFYSTGATTIDSNVTISSWHDYFFPQYCDIENHES